MPSNKSVKCPPVASQHAVHKDQIVLRTGLIRLLVFLHCQHIGQVLGHKDSGNLLNSSHHEGRHMTLLRGDDSHISVKSQKREEPEMEPKYRTQDAYAYFLYHKQRGR